MRKNWRVNARPNVRFLNRNSDYSHVSTSVPFYIYDCVKSLFSVSFTGNWFSISHSGSDTHREHRSRAFFLSLRGNCLPCTRGYVVLSCMPTEILRCFSSRSIERSWTTNAEIASFHSPMKILWATCSNRAWSEKYILPSPFRKLFFIYLKK